MLMPAMSTQEVKSAEEEAIKAKELVDGASKVIDERRCVETSLLLFIVFIRDLISIPPYFITCVLSIV